ncbi:MAG: DedA family protein [Thermomicrobiales bacterium]
MAVIVTLIARTFNESTQALLRSHALAVIVVIIFFEELGVPSPIPGDLMMVYAGVRVTQGHDALWAVLLLQELATVLGASGLFFLSRRYGRPLVERYGRFIHLGPETLARMEGRIQRRGGWAIVLGRILPGLRIITPIAAGVLGMPFSSFLPALALGGFLYILGYTLLGVFVGPAALALYDRISLPVSALASLAVLAALFFAMRQLRRAPPAFTQDRHGALASSLIAGVLAGVAGLLAANSVSEFITFGRRLAGYQRIAVTRGVGSGLRFVLAWPAFLVCAALLGLLAYVIGVARLARWQTILLSAGVPLIVSLAVLYPLTEQRHLGLSEYREQIIFAVDAMRWLVYGLALTAFLPLLPHLRRAEPEMAKAGRADSTVIAPPSPGRD